MLNTFNHYCLRMLISFCFFTLCWFSYLTESNLLIDAKLLILKKLTINMSVSNNSHCYISLPLVKSYIIVVL